MKRLNKIQKEIEGLAGRVPFLTPKQIEWAKRNFNYYAIVMRSKKEVRCPSCKCHFDRTSVKRERSKYGRDDVYTCPHCGAKIQLNILSDSLYYDRRSTTPKPTYHQQDYFEVMNVVGGWQVTRLIYMQRYCYIRKPSTDWEFFEVCQAWNRPDCAKTYFRSTGKRMMSQWSFNPYRLWQWSIEKNEDGSYKVDEDGQYMWYGEPAELQPRRMGGADYFGTKAIAPSAQILPQYKRMGITAKALRSCSARFSAEWVFECFSDKTYKPMYETLFKSGSYRVLDAVCDGWRAVKAEQIFNAWKVCQRNHYKECDTTEWLDLVDMLVESNMDYRSPYYVCPKDLKAMHQRLVNKREQEREKQRLKEEMKKNEEYHKRIEKFLDMDIHNKNLRIVVLPSIKAFKDEADHLHHCVWRCHYYDKEDSLILSARGEKDKRWETLEVSLKNFSILQCYGYGDSFTERHSEITSLMNKNMWQIKQRMSA